MQANSLLLDQNDNPISELKGSESRKPVPLDQIPAVMSNAVLAIEDSRFYEHEGVDYRSLGRALWVDITTGDFSQGASTITQQLVKLTYLSPEKTIKRKIQEAYIAMQMEKTFGKEQILEIYLNRIYFGHGAYGVQVASQRFFGKDVKDLTIAEAALIAGLPRSPTLYSPVNYPEKALNRRNLVLQAMKEQGKITEEELKTALATPLPGKLFEDPGGAYPHPAFLDQVIRELVEYHGLSEEEIFQGGLKIKTTMDPNIQTIAEEVIANPSNFPAPMTSTQQVEGALAVIDHTTGEIRALAGGRDYQTRRGFNRATMLQRQPGSTIKPILVYAPAMESGYNPESVLNDDPININGYSPGNADGIFRGPVTIRQAVAQSINVPAVLLYRAVGTEKGAQFARAAGIPLEPNESHLSLALGGMTHGVSPMQMAGAFGTLANQGVYYTPHTVLQVTDSTGRQLLTPPEGQKVYSPVAAYLTTSMLTTAVQSGTGTNARMNRPVAGKTGTTEMPKSQYGNMKGNKDAWFVGYTPELTCAVWIGYDQTDSKNYLYQQYGGMYPAKIFREVISRSLQGVPSKNFEVPAGAQERLTGIPWPLAPQMEEEKKEDPKQNNSTTPPSSSRGRIQIPQIPLEEIIPEIPKKRKRN